jgi:hypothetical protein
LLDEREKTNSDTLVEAKGRIESLPAVGEAVLAVVAEAVG